MTSTEQDVAREFFALRPEDRRPEYRNQERAIVGAWRVKPGMREIVYSTLKVAVYHLELPPVQVRWMVPLRYAHPGERRIDTPIRRDAMTEPHEHPTEIFLSPWARTPVNTVLHEARHLFQWQDGHIGPPASAERWLTAEQEDELELDATIWAATTQRELGLTEYAACEDRGVIR